jgi:hypothetical protein
MSDIPIDPDELVIRSRDKQVGLRLPLAVDQRIDALLARATAAGERTNRRELVAALLATIDLSGDELGAVLRKFRTSRVSEVLLDREDFDAGVIALRSHRPGPRIVR